MTGNKIIKEDLEQIVEAPLDWTVFSGKTVLITGANGFLPAYMVETFLYLNYTGMIKDSKVLALVRNIAKAKSRFKEYLNYDNLEFIVQNVCDPISIDQKIDIVIHAASHASPKYYKIDPVGTLTPNVIGTMNLLELAKQNRTQCFLFFSSSEVYGTTEINKPIKETDFGYLDPLSPRASYPESKRMGETICLSWYNQYKVPIRIVRPFHTYGPGVSLNDGRVFADFISFILKNQDLVINSDGSALRSYCYLKDAILGCFYVMIKGTDGEAYNIGNPSQEYSVKKLASTVLSMFPEKSLKIVMNSVYNNPSYSPPTVSRILPDISKLEDLGWYPIVDVKSGFHRTVLSYY